MKKEEITITNPSGLHARPASDFILLAKTFESRVSLQKKGEGEPVNGKSIMKVLTLGIVQGDSVILTVEGNDEEKAFPALKEKLTHAQD
jgi:phosphocarrier protein HPr